MGFLDRLKDWWDNVSIIEFLVPDVILNFFSYVNVLFNIIIDIVLLIFVLVFCAIFFIIQYYLIKFYIWIIKNIIIHIPVIREFVIVQIISKIDTILPLNNNSNNSNNNRSNNDTELKKE